MASSEDEEVLLECQGFFQDQIVGIQYYAGEVNRNEVGAGPGRAAAAMLTPHASPVLPASLPLFPPN